MADYNDLTRYGNIRDGLDTGDIVLFSNKNKLMQFWQYLTDCKWTHVGMVVKSEEMSALYLWESTTDDDLIDCESYTHDKGVQTVFLSNRLKTYKGDIAIRKLDYPALNTNRSDVIRELNRFRKSHRDTDFEKKPLQLLKAFIDEGFLSSKNKEDLSSVFCSELIAEAYQTMGLLDKDGKPSNEYTPKDFSSQASIREFQLLQGASLDDEQTIITYSA